MRQWGIDIAMPNIKILDEMSVLQPDACDSHIHVFDDRFPVANSVSRKTIPTGATASDFREIQRNIGFRRVVIVTPRIYDTDNSVTVDAIQQLGRTRSRGIAVLRPDVEENTLEELDAAGIVGVRLTLHTLTDAPTNIDMLPRLADKIKHLGWHIQLHLNAAQIVDCEALLRTIPTPVVIDHFGRIPSQAAIASSSHKVIELLLGEGRGWLKLSAPYLDYDISKQIEEINKVASYWIRHFPDRLVWGSDWPHTMANPKPRFKSLIQMMNDWTADKSTQQRIMVTNPAELYGFHSSGLDKEYY